MAYNKNIAENARNYLSEIENVEEKLMFGGICFMVNDKMCAGVMHDDLMCRINPDLTEKMLEKEGASLMNFSGREMRGYILVDDKVLNSSSDYKFWLDLCIQYNAVAPASKKKK